MANEPTIIVGKINDKQLKDSIDKLVQHVAEGTSKMVNNFNQSIEQMKNKLKELGSTKVEIGGSATAKQKEETAATKEQTSALKQKKQTLDEVAQAQKNALRIAYQRALKIPTDDVDLARAKLERLQALLRDNRKFQFMSPTQIANSTFEIQRLVNYIHSADAAQKQLNQSIVSTQHYTSEQIQRFKDWRDAIHNAAEAARNAFKTGATSFPFSTTSFVTGKTTLGTIYAENDARAKGLTIEQQVLEIYKQQRAEEQAHIASKQQKSGLTKEEIAQLHQQLAAEQAITQEVQKRKTYSKPDTWNVHDPSASLNMYMAKALNGKQRVNWDEETSSLKTLQAALKQYKEVYSQMSAKERNSPMGKQMISDMQVLERTIKQVQQTMQKPTEFAAIKNMPTNTLDAIAEKMRALASYRSGLDVNKQKDEINQVNAEYDRWKKKMDEVMQKNNQMINSNNALTRSWNYMKNRLAFYFTVGASTSFIKNLIQVRSEYEMNERALGILIDSAERGTQIFNELSQMALVSPYTLIELSTAAKQLTAYDIAAKDVVDTTRRLADMAAAVGIPIERLTYALGQIKAYGYLNARDARMFSNAGIPLVKQLSEYYSELEGHLVNTADIYDRIKKKAIGFNDVINVINHMTDEGGKFFDFQAKMADTLKVRLANLTLAWNNMLNDIGKQEQGILTSGIGLLKDLFANWNKIVTVVKNAVTALLLLRAIIFAVAIKQKVWNGVIMNTNNQMRFTAARSGVYSAMVKAFGERVANFTRTVYKGILGIGKAMLAFLPIMAIVSFINRFQEAEEAVKNFNNTVKEGAKDNYENVKEFLEQYKELKDSLYTWGTGTDSAGNATSIQTGTRDISDTEAGKMWDAIREQIELTTQSSEVYIGRLLQIENLSERLRQGFKLLEDLNEVNAVLKEIDDNTIQINQDWSAWWNLGFLPDGLIENIKDVKKEINEIIEKYGSLDKALSQANGTNKAWSDTKDYRDELQALRDDLDETVNSINNLINSNNWANEPDKITEVYSKITKKISETGNLSPEEAFILQTEIEEARTKAVENALTIRLQDTLAAAAAASDEEEKIRLEAIADTYLNEWKLFNTTTASERVQWERFTKYLKEQHSSEIGQMFRNMDKEQIESINFQEGEYASFVKRMVEGYAKKHKMTYDEAFNYLKSWITDANQWSIFIKIHFLTDDAKSVADTLKGLDQQLNEVEGDIERLEQDLTNPFSDEKSREKTQKELSDLRERQKQLKEQRAQSKKDEKEKEKAEKEAERNRKKQAAADRKAQKEAETELQKAFKDEMQLIDKVRSQYKKLTDSNVKGGDALNMVTTQFENSIEHINKVLGDNGLPLFDISTFAGTDNPSKLLELLDSQLKAAKGAKNVKPAELKELEIKIGDLIIDAKAYNTKKVTDGLNNELNKLKEDYEIALELDANPELGDIFSDILGVKNYALPQTFGDLLDEANKVARKKLKELEVDNKNFDLLSSLIVPDANNKYLGLEMDSGFVEALISVQKTYRDMFKKNITDSEKMLDDYVKKYGDYSDKIAEIEADKQKKLKELDNDYPISQRMRPEYTAKRNAIEQGALRELGQAQFDEFKNSRLYVTMFENLQTVSKATLVAIRQKLVELKDELGTLSPEQLKQVTQQFEKIDQELVRRNPFKNLVKNVKDYAKAIGKEGKKAQSDFLKAQESYDAQLNVVAALKQQLEEKKALEDGDKEGLQTLMERISSEEIILAILKKQLDEAEALNEQYNLMRKAFKDNAASISKLIGVIADNLQSLKDFRDYMEDTFGVDMGNNINAIIDDLAGVGEGLNQITSSAQSGNVFGVVTGVVKSVTGVGDAIASIFGDGAARTKRLNKEIEKSAAEVWRLNYAYKELERSVNKSLGGAEIHARRLAIANKEAELAEEERQLALEKRKRGKDKDNDAIKQSQEKIQDLRHEIADLKDEIVTNLLGSDVKAAAEEFVDTWVQAWKAGEVTLDAIEEKMNDMIYNLIKKAATSKIVANILKPLYDAIDEYTKAESRGGEELTADEIKDLSSLSESLSAKINDALGAYYGNMKAIGALPDAGKNLSALQQGIQSITEDTAGALEAYMNSVSQQVYLHSDLLTQIRDTVTSFNLDVQVATIGQILMQLQSSYQVQMAIQGIMEGWTTPNGMAVRVELNS